MSESLFAHSVASHAGAITPLFPPKIDSKRPLKATLAPDGRRAEIICDSCLLGTAGESIKPDTYLPSSTRTAYAKLSAACTNRHQRYAPNLIVEKQPQRGGLFFCTSVSQGARSAFRAACLPEKTSEYNCVVVFRAW